jgi:hypothetical protein
MVTPITGIPSGTPSVATTGGSAGNGGSKLDSLLAELGISKEELKKMLESANKDSGGCSGTNGKAGDKGGSAIAAGDLNGNGKVGDQEDLEIAAQNLKDGKPVNTPKEKKGDGSTSTQPTSGAIAGPAIGTGAGAGMGAGITGG